MAVSSDSQCVIKANFHKLFHMRLTLKSFLLSETKYYLQKWPDHEQTLRKKSKQ